MTKPFILVGMSDGDEKRGECEAAGRARWWWEGLQWFVKSEFFNNFGKLLHTYIIMSVPVTLRRHLRAGH